MLRSSQNLLKRVHSGGGCLPGQFLHQHLAFLAGVGHRADGHAAQLLALVDLLLGGVVLGTAVTHIDHPLTPGPIITFSLMLAAGLLVLYAFLDYRKQLAAASLVFWHPGFMITWVFDTVFQMARYPVGVYPGWLRLVLTWVVPVGLITPVPAAALSGNLPVGLLLGSFFLALILVFGASLLFRTGLRRYASASS